MELPERICFGITLDLAKRFSKYQEFYFPHQLDFRGRAYPVPVFMHYQADDVSRGLLEFAEGRGAWGDAERWVKIHLANCCGIDKLAFGDRIAWVDARRETFMAWTKQPLDADDWMRMEKPFQSLAAAFALFDPEARAHLPIQLDGSNNALQHYGAMLRCPQTAAAANLTRRDKPADPYTEIAAMVARMVSEDAKGNATAASLEGWITRKIVKQTVMTTYYGVTMVGARRQTHEHLKKAGFVGINAYNASRYVAKKTILATGQICLAAHKAMQWLSDCARKITAAGEAVAWKTPSGFEVVQPYRNSRNWRVATVLGTMELATRLDTMPVHGRKQIQGFPPNFVHSVDAGHMMATAVACQQAAITFAAVHDCFWCHAADMDRMGGIVRREFVRLHERPLLDDLWEQLTHEYPNIKFDKPPKPGSFDVSAVLNATYAFA